MVYLKVRGGHSSKHTHTQHICLCVWVEGAGEQVREVRKYKICVCVNMFIQSVPGGKDTISGGDCTDKNKKRMSSKHKSQVTLTIHELQPGKNFIQFSVTKVKII